MRTIWISLIVVLSFLLLANCNNNPSPSPTSPPPPPTFNLDHFVAYEVSLRVPVEDQFIKKYLKRPYRIKLEGIEIFANVVSKDGETLKDPNAHLAWYRIPEQRPPGNLTIKYLNQITNFKEKSMTVGAGRALLVPSEKVEGDSKFPKKLDHYICYQVARGSDQPKTVTLVDQFKTNTTRVIGPLYFCAPCSKPDEPIKNKEDHLTVYAIKDDKPVNKTYLIQNQFGEQRLTFEKQIFLLVPTKKVDFSSPGIPSKPTPGQPIEKED